MNLDRLVYLEGVIEKGITWGQAAADAVAEIRDQRLYRQSHANFEDYCRERWGWTRDYADKMIAAGKVLAQLPTTVVKPANEAVARELAPLRQEPERLQAAWQEAQERAEPTGKPPTAAIVRQVVRGDVVRVPDASDSGDRLVRLMNELDDMRRLPRGELLAALRDDRRLVLVNIAVNARWLLEVVDALNGDKKLEVVK